MPDQSKDPFGEARILGIRTPEAVVASADQVISELEAHLAEFPGPYDPLNGTRYIVWERRAMMGVGKVQGWISALSSVGVLQVETAEKLKRRAIALITHATAKVQMGNRS
jgi:hypothetical protein